LCHGFQDQERRKINMCRIITPEDEDDGGHFHAHEPLEAAELLRDNLVQELSTMGDLFAHLHGMEHAAGAQALRKAIVHKRAAVDVLYRALRAAEEEGLETPEGGSA